MDNVLVRSEYSEPSDLPGMSSSDLSVLYLNIRSLPAHSDDLVFLLTNLNGQGISVDIILLCETNLTSVNHTLFQLPGYKFLEHHRKVRAGGGVGIFVKDVYSTILRNDIGLFVEGTFESLFCDVYVGKTKITVGTIYRVPNTPLGEYIANIENVYSKLSRTNSIKIVGTDQNLDYLKINSNHHAMDVLNLNLIVMA